MTHDEFWSFTEPSDLRTFEVKADFIDESTFVIGWVSESELSGDSVFECLTIQVLETRYSTPIKLLCKYDWVVGVA